MCNIFDLCLVLRLVVGAECASGLERARALGACEFGVWFDVCHVAKRCSGLRFSDSHLHRARRERPLGWEGLNAALFCIAS